MTDEDAYRQALENELVELWNDLAEQYRSSRAVPPEGSPGCMHLIGRIQTITKLVGPASYDSISLPFLLTGTYERVHAEIGLTVPVPAETLSMAREYVAGEKAERPKITVNLESPPRPRDDGFAAGYAFGLRRSRAGG